MLLGELSQVVGGCHTGVAATDGADTPQLLRNWQARCSVVAWFDFGRCNLYVLCCVFRLSFVIVAVCLQLPIIIWELATPCKIVTSLLTGDLGRNVHVDELRPRWRLKKKYPILDRYQYACQPQANRGRDCWLPPVHGVHVAVTGWRATRWSRR
jgi:hypothetical protein